MISVIYKHEKGFWVADVYLDGIGPDGTPPDWYCTGKRGQDRDEIVRIVTSEFPGIEVVNGVTGTCQECGEEYFESETHCECGEPLEQW